MARWNRSTRLTQCTVAIAWVLAGQMLAGETEPLSWVKVTENADWKPRDSSGEVVFGGKMWLLGGWFTSHAPCPNDVWNSTDGIHWKEVTPRAAWIHADLPTTLVHDNRMWMMAGWAGGRLSGASASNQVSVSYTHLTLPTVYSV